MSLNIILYTPNKTMCNTVSEEIFLPTPDGEICIQPRHQQLVSALSIGLLRFKEGSAWNLFVVYCLEESQCVSFLVIQHWVCVKSSTR